MRSLSSERGMALPMVLLIMTVFAVLLAAGFSVLGSERRVHANDEVQLDAFTLAETGLASFFAQRTTTQGSTPPAAAESTRITFASGYADVVSQRVRADDVARRYGYVVRSHGVSTVKALRGTPQAERTVAQYAVWHPSTMSVLGSWTSLNGLSKTGASGMGSGTDACGAQGAVAGVAVANPPGYSQTGSPSAPQGNPPIRNLGNQAADSVKIDWAGIVNGNVFTPDIIIPGAPWPSFADPNYWPVIRVNGDYTLPGDGRGTLIVTGALTIAGGKTWNGVVLVGQNLTSSGNNGVIGATITGLNVKLGMNPPADDLGNGEKRYNFNSCNIGSAMKKFGRLVPYTNAWVDNWPSY